MSDFFHFIRPHNLISHGIMGALTFGVLALVIGIGYNYQNGLELLGFNFNPWGFFIKQHPVPELEIVFENFALWLTFYLAAYIILYIEPIRAFFKTWKVDPSYPRKLLVAKEFFRSLRGILICSTFEVLVNWGYEQEPSVLPCYNLTEPILGIALHDFDIHISHVLRAGLLVYLWGDFHFYWIHRWMHMPAMYRWVSCYNLCFHIITAVCLFLYKYIGTQVASRVQQPGPSFRSQYALV